MYFVDLCQLYIYIYVKNFIEINCHKNSDEH